MTEPLLEVEDLTTHFFTREGVVKAVDGVSFSVSAGQVLSIVGESGSGKTATALSILNIVPYPGRILDGRVRFKGRDLVTASPEDLRFIRGNEIAMIFQDPITSLNPILPVGDQTGEILLSHASLTKREVRERTLDAFEKVGMPDPRRVMESYPFQLSGGMCQRVMMAMVLLAKPDLLIADEPTSALDTTLQAEMLERFDDLRRDQGTAIIFITHNMGVVAKIADEVMVLYGGHVMEHAETVSLFQRPANPYTWALLSSVARLDLPDKALRPVPGAPPDLKDAPDECPFLPRCNKATMTCRTSSMPPLEEVEPHHWSACYNPVWQEGR